MIARFVFVCDAPPPPAVSTTARTTVITTRASATPAPPNSKRRRSGAVFGAGSGVSFRFLRLAITVSYRQDNTVKYSAPIGVASSRQLPLPSPLTRPARGAPGPNIVCSIARGVRRRLRAQHRQVDETANRNWIRRRASVHRRRRARDWGERRGRQRLAMESAKAKALGWALVWATESGSRSAPA